ncbi:MAG: FtsX-like permease family protein [Proteobacteria bacterium]|nr:FtsX-like permease family protein [Pseudomonadota bacterium]
MTLLPLIRTCFRTSKSHPLRTFLLVFGIALGVAGTVAIDIAKTSVSRSFDLSTAALTSRSTHQVVGSQFSLPQSIFTKIRTHIGIHDSAPVITAQVQVKELNFQAMTLMGVDPFSEKKFRAVGFQQQDRQFSGNLAHMITRASGVLMSSSLARAHDLKVGRHLTLMFGDREVQVPIAGVIEGKDTTVGQAFQGILLADISLAQEILVLEDRISRIDLVLKDDSEIEAVKNLLSPSMVLVKTDQQNQTIRSLSKSFETSLTAFSMLTLFMGIFLIYNTVSFSVARQRKLNGTLRALGATRQEIFWAVEAEVMVYALVGSVLGLVLGIALGKGAVHGVCATVSDMYFTLTVSQIHISPVTLVKGIATGLLASIAASLVPALNAAGTRPITLMQPSGGETSFKGYIPGLALAGGGMIMGALMIFSRSESSSTLIFSGVFLVFGGSSFLSPCLVLGLTRLIPSLLGSVAGLLKKGAGPQMTLAGMALRNIRRSLSRSSVLIASLMVVISVYIGIDTMTTSFRRSIIDWVEGHIGGDIHISSTDELNRSLDPVLVEKIQGLEGVSGISAYNIHKVFSRVSGEVHIFSYVRDLSEKQWTWTALNKIESDAIGPPGTGTTGVEPDGKSLNALLEDDWIFVSEIFARRNGFIPGPGAFVTMETLKGPVSFKVAGVFRDFFMGGGRVIVSRDAMKTYWGHQDITAVQVFVKDRSAIDRRMADVLSLISDKTRVSIRSGLSIKAGILGVFDKTFLITSALQVLTAIVALTGILNSVMALILERSRELGILRACGADPGQIRSLVLWECTFNGFFAGVFALPLGYALAWILVYIVNYTAFGWTYEMQASMSTFVQALVFSSLAAFGAGMVPAIGASRISVAQALRTE